MSPVRTIESSYVGVPETAAPPPEPIKFTAMEALWVIIPVLQHVLLYEAADDMPPFDAIVQSLRSSLAATLGSFAPLAGKLVHLEETGDVGISCSASDGVRFVVAECDADIGRLAGDEEHDLPLLEGLVPEVDMSKLPTPVLAVQATRFEGGVAIGLTVHHGVADGRALWTFVEAWATACRGETPATTPCFDRSLVKLPGGEELARSVLRKVAPNLPSVAIPSSLLEDRKRFTRRTFTLDARDIQCLKQRIVHLGESHGAPLPHSPSTFTAVVALTWTCFARSKPFSSEDDAQLFFFADTRDRLDPPVDAGYIGACLTGCLSKLPVPELRGDCALAAAASAVQDEINKVKEDPVAGWNFFMMVTIASMDRMMNISGSSGFRAYEVADFGWGKPRRTEPIRMNHDGQVALMRSRDGQGVQVSVSLLQPVTPPSLALEDRKRFTRRTFTLDGQDIQRLKQRIFHLNESHGTPLPRPPSAFAAVVALAWTCYARCKSFCLDDDVWLFFFADIRERLDPPVNAGYIGSCLTKCLSSLPARVLYSERALAAAASAVQNEINKMKEDPIVGWNFLYDPMPSLDRLMNISGSSGFRAYDIADFGWGKPKRTEPIRMNHDGQVALMGSRDGRGVQVSVSLLQAAQMDEFKSNFLMLLE